MLFWVFNKNGRIKSTEFFLIVLVWAFGFLGFFGREVENLKRGLFWDCVCLISLASELGLGASLSATGCWCRVWICVFGTGISVENWVVFEGFCFCLCYDCFHFTRSCGLIVVCLSLHWHAVWLVSEKMEEMERIYECWFYVLCRLG